MPVLSQVLKSVPQLRSATLLAELPTGLCHRSWRLAAEGGEVVLRIDTPLASRMHLDRKSEAKVLSIVSVIGVAPELLWFDLKRGIQVTRYIPGGNWRPEDFKLPDNFSRLGAVLSRIHSLPVEGDWPDRLAFLRRYADIVATRTAQKLLGEAEGLARQLNRSANNRLAICHGDLHAQNIVDNDELTLIDWEYAGVMNPLLDLASFAVQHELDSDSAAALVAGYNKAAGDINPDAFDLACALYDCTALLWYLALNSLGENSTRGIVVPSRYEARLSHLT
jgi:thiamine kinase-like enzyme